MPAGQEVFLTDGLGHLFKAVIVDAHPRACVLELLGQTDSQAARSPRLHLVVAPTKGIDRFEWLLEKATECGIDEITPVFCENSERTVLKHDRCRKIMVSAMKQSLRAWLPVLHQGVPFRQFLMQPLPDAGFIAWCGESDKQPFSRACHPLRDTTILIGPEGDFSEQEFRQALSAGYQAISLGDHRLRTETAALSACIGFNMINKMPGPI